MKRNVCLNKDLSEEGSQRAIPFFNGTLFTDDITVSGGKFSVVILNHTCNLIMFRGRPWDDITVLGPCSISMVLLNYVT